jgi:hypothetical protein
MRLNALSLKRNEKHKYSLELPESQLRLQAASCDSFVFDRQAELEGRTLRVIAFGP